VLPNLEPQIALHFSSMTYLLLAAEACRDFAAARLSEAGAW
jgi:hypothetical protein